MYISFEYFIFLENSEVRKVVASYLSGLNII